MTVGKRRAKSGWAYVGGGFFLAFAVALLCLIVQSKSDSLDYARRHYPGEAATISLSLDEFHPSPSNGFVCTWEIQHQRGAGLLLRWELLPHRRMIETVD